MNLSLSKLPLKFKVIEAENILINIFNRGFINEEPREEIEVEILNKYRKEDIVRSFIHSLPIGNWRYREHISIPSEIRQRPKILNFLIEINDEKYPIYCIRDFSDVDRKRNLIVRDKKMFDENKIKIAGIIVLFSENLEKDENLLNYFKNLYTSCYIFTY